VPTAGINCPAVCQPQLSKLATGTDVEHGISAQMAGALVDKWLGRLTVGLLRTRPLKVTPTRVPRRRTEEKDRAWRSLAVLLPHDFLCLRCIHNPILACYIDTYAGQHVGRCRANVVFSDPYSLCTYLTAPSSYSSNIGKTVA
jgi:hypothetical protein